MAAFHINNLPYCVFCFINLILVLLIPTNLAASDRFTEELFIKPFPSGHVYSYFQFTTVWDIDTAVNSYEHCHLFPRALGEIIARHNVEELHISLTNGLWRHENWGYPVVDAPPGAELWVWFKPDTQDIDSTWNELTSTLSGLLCASLNFIDASNSMSPEFSFRPAGVSNKQLNSSLLRYSTLPREIVCTENLTPWKKLLPCDSVKGLGTLLRAGDIHNTNYHSLGIHLRNICRDDTCEEASVELKQTVSLVYDLVILESTSQDFSLKKLFGGGLSGHCPLSDASRIYIDISSNSTKNEFHLHPPPTSTIISQKGGSITTLAVYDVKQLRITNMFNVALNYKGPKTYTVKQSPILHFNRYLVGYGQEKGGIVTKMYNKHWQPLDVVILENIPWFVPIYLHTLKITSDGETIQPLKMKYIPGRQRQNPYSLELVVRLPPRTTTILHLDLDYVFLKWQEYPPDANHGFYIGSAVISVELPLAKDYTSIPIDGSYFSDSFNASRSGYFIQLRTESIIISLPTPDFSMPYNVICLACTVIALAFGPIHNITTKRLRTKLITKNSGLISLVLGKVGALFCSLFKRSKKTEVVDSAKKTN